MLNNELIKDIINDRKSDEPLFIVDLNEIINANALKERLYYNCGS